MPSFLDILKKNKRGEFNFVLIFALFAGAMFLLLAIFGAVRMGETVRRQNEAEMAKIFDVITNPLGAGFAEASTSKITFGEITRINNECNAIAGKFGENRVTIQTKSSVGKQWSNSPLEYSIPSKYLFSESLEGKVFYVYSKPFYTGFKVTDILLISTQDYCFVNPPQEIEVEVMGLKIPNIGVHLFNGTTTCKEGSKRICFGTSGCDVTVTGECLSALCESNYDYGIVRTLAGSRYYSGSLIYAAILSDIDVYECNVQRILYRASRVAEIISKKIDITSLRGGCSSGLKTDLEILRGLLERGSPKDLGAIYLRSKELETKNTREGICGAW